MAIGGGKGSGDDADGAICFAGHLGVVASQWESHLASAQPVDYAERAAACHSSKWAKVSPCQRDHASLAGPCPVCGLCPPVSYIDPADMAEKTRTDCIAVFDDTEMLTPGWYAPAGNLTLPHRLVVDGDVNLILVDGATITAGQGIRVAAGSSLAIWWQSGQSGELVAMNERNAKTCRKYKCRYFRKDVVFEDTPLRLFFVQYGRNTKWNILLTTDKSLSFVKVFEYYQIRWNQEVMYRESKQYLGLGKCQSTDFDAQIADCTLALATYTILTLYRRFGEYETIGELFRSMQTDLMALTLWQRILPIMAQILYRLCHLLGADFEQTMQTLQAGGDEGEEIILMLSMVPVPNEG